MHISFPSVQAQIHSAKMDLIRRQLHFLIDCLRSQENSGKSEEKLG
jgi:hypothetical protein